MNFSPRQFTLSLFAGLSLTTASLFAQEAASVEKPSFSASQTVQMTATVTAIDMATRSVTLQGEGGETETIVVGEEARNLGQVKAGDVLTVEFVRELDVQVFADDGSELGSGAVKIEIGQRYALKDVAQAHRDLESRRTTGSTVLLP